MAATHTRVSLRWPGFICRVNQRSPGRQSPSAPFGCGAQIGWMRGKITRMEIRRRLGPVVMNHLRAREDEHEDWGPVEKLTAQLVASNRECPRPPSVLHTRRAYTHNAVSDFLSPLRQDPRTLCQLFLNGLISISVIAYRLVRSRHPPGSSHDLERELRNQAPVITVTGKAFFGSGSV